MIYFNEEDTGPEPEPVLSEAIAFSAILTLIFLPQEITSGMLVSAVGLIVLRFFAFLALGVAASYVWHHRLTSGSGFFKIRNRYVVIGYAGMCLFLISLVLPAA